MPTPSGYVRGGGRGGECRRHPSAYLLSLPSLPAEGLGWVGLGRGVRQRGRDARKAGWLGERRSCCYIKRTLTKYSKENYIINYL